MQFLNLVFLYGYFPKARWWQRHIADGINQRLYDNNGDNID